MNTKELWQEETSSKGAKSSRKKRWLRFVLVLFISLLLVSVCLEGFVRIFDPFGVSHFGDMNRYLCELCTVVGPPRILEHKPNSTLACRDFTITTNRLGLRGGDVAEEKPEGEYRLLFLGDSVVLGWGVEEEDLFLNQAERELNDGAPSHQSFRCVNAGHNQYDTTQEAALLDELGDRIKPDVVFLVYVINDVVPTLKTWESLERVKEELMRNPPGFHDRILGGIQSELRRLFPGINSMLTLLFKIQGQENRTKEAQEREAKGVGEGWEASREGFLKIRGWCRQREIPFVVLNHTRPGDEIRSPGVPPLIPFLTEEKITFFPFHFTPEERKLPMYHSYSDPHANRLGHELMMNKLRPTLRSMGLKTR